MWRHRRAALIGITASLGLHLSLALVLLRLPAPSEALSRAELEVRFDVDGDGRTGSGRRAGGRPRAQDAPPLEPGGPRSAQNIDAPHPGHSGERSGARRGVLLLDRSEGITLQDTPMNTLRQWQTQRLRTASDRASWERRRATPNPASTPFLASGAGSHPERRPVAERDARRGARRAPPASRQGARDERRAGDRDGPRPPASGEAGIEAARRADPPDRGAEDASRRRGSERASPGRGIQRGRGRRAAEAAAVAHGRPPVDEGPAATPARRQGRVRDDEDSELLAASMVESMVEATRRKGQHQGPGQGGRAGEGAPGSGGERGEGGRATPHGPGPGRFASLDTADARYRRWYLEQRRRVERALVFPRERQLAMDQGTSVFRLLVRRDGRLARQPELLRSSGFDDLDAAARSAIRQSTPFAPLPSDLAPAHETVAVTLGVQFENPMVH